MTTDDRVAVETARDIEEALAMLCERRDELVDSAAAELLDVSYSIEENDLDVDLADGHHEAVLRGVDEVIGHLRSFDEAGLLELARLSAIRLDDRRGTAVEDLRTMRPPPEAGDPAALTFDEDDEEYYRDDEVRRVLVENVDDQAHHLRYLSDYAADLVSAIVAIGRTGDRERTIATLHARDAVTTALRTTFKAWETALATLDSEAPGSAGIASEMIETASVVLPSHSRPGP